MQRRLFLKNSILTSLGLVLVPSAILADTVELNTFTLPVAQEHIRHGLLQYNRQSILGGLYKIQRDLFLNEEDGNLEHWTLEKDGLLVNVGLDKEMVYIHADDYYREFELRQFHEVEVALGDEEISQAQLLVFRNEQMIDTSTSKALFVLKGKVRLNKTVLEEGIGVELNQATSLKIEGEKAVVFVI